MSRTARERYVHLRQSFWRHPSVRSVSKSARWLYVAAMSYAMDCETDGVIPESALGMLDGTKREATELVKAGLWIAGDGDYTIKSYLEHNKSSAELQSQYEAKRIAGSRGGTAKAKRVAGATPVATAKAKQAPSKRPSKPPSKSLQDREEEKELPTVAPPNPPRGERDPDSFEARSALLLREHAQRYESATGNCVPSAKNTPQDVGKVVAFLAGLAARRSQPFAVVVVEALDAWWPDTYAAAKGWPMWHLARHIDEYTGALPALRVVAGGMTRAATPAEHAADAAEGIGF